MAKFRKKPVVIEAWKAEDILVAAEKNWKGLPPPIAAAYETGGWVFMHDGIYIPTLEGSMLAQPSDWVIQGVKGEFYPCKPDIFEATYDPIG